MWMLTFIPDSVIYSFVNTIFWAGVVGTLLGFVFNLPFLRPYRLIVQIAGIMLLVAGVYFKGGYEVETQWRERVKEMEQKVAVAAEKSKTANAEIQTKIVTKTKVIHDTKVVTKQVLKEIEKRIDSECTISPEAINILNAAARGDAAVGSDQGAVK
jgi:hypothetical protein